MENSNKIGFIGAGNMAYALISGLIESGFSTQNIKLSDTDTSLLSQRKLEFGLEVFTNNSQLSEQCEVIVLAVKPQILPVVCKEIQAYLNHKPLIISIAAGVKSVDINRWLGGNAAIVRTMPNTPALLGKGATGLFANEAVNEEQKHLASLILGAVGYCVWIKDEPMLDAVTALSGSGPAYFFLMMESMTNAGIELGLDSETAEKLSIQTALGAAMMAEQSGKSVGELRDNVTSKGGTTQAAIASFQNQNFELVVANAMHAAFERAKAMGDELGKNE
ncbi:Pyrroline-5-carboxylate reductase [uncultured Candidatus Thioglobus sp.]|nr:Pyrroline-5-carboxylate reductase [uncultured Candidatus Thioglobus sp.]